MSLSPFRKSVPLGSSAGVEVSAPPPPGPPDLGGSGVQRPHITRAHCAALRGGRLGPRGAALGRPGATPGGHCELGAQGADPQSEGRAQAPRMGAGWGTERPGLGPGCALPSSPRPVIPWKFSLLLSDSNKSFMPVSTFSANFP